MNIGYACIALCVNGTCLKSCMLKNADENNLRIITANNLRTLDNIIEYNNENNIRLLRISSDIIPFGSNPVNKIQWEKEFAKEFYALGEKIKKYNIRVSMHPGQYTVLNSANEAVYKRAVEDLQYHTKVLNCLETDKKSKIVIHIGGIYDNKDESVKRFMKNYKLISGEIKKKLVIENDDNCYNINDVLNIGFALDIPVVYDVLHNKINPYNKEEKDSYYINKCKGLWRCYDGNVKIHYSQSGPGRKGTHSQSITVSEFMDFYNNIKTDADIMLEVKDKNISAVKCINCINCNADIIKDIKRYGYTLLEKSSDDYYIIDGLISKKHIIAVDIYKKIEEALKKEPTEENFLTAAQAVFCSMADETEACEKNKFNIYIKEFYQGKSTTIRIKNYLYGLAVKYNKKEVYDSYYFYY